MTLIKSPINQNEIDLKIKEIIHKKRYRPTIIHLSKYFSNNKNCVVYAKDVQINCLILVRSEAQQILDSLCILGLLEKQKNQQTEKVKYLKKEFDKWDEILRIIKKEEQDGSKRDNPQV